MLREHASEVRYALLVEEIGLAIAIDRSTHRR